MKWALIVYFYVAGTWYTAEELHMTEFPTTLHASAESCIQAQHSFTEAHPDIGRVRAGCEQTD